MAYPTHLTNKLGTEPIGKLIWNYSLPAIVATVVMSFYNIVDRIFLGQGVGPLAISGLALTFPFMNVLMAFGMLVGAGSAARISITLGQQDINKAEKILANALILTFIISGAAIIVSYIFMSDLLRLFGGSENTIRYAEDFMRIIIPANIFSTLNFGFNNIVRASGYPRKAMLNMIVCAVINIILDAVFIFGLDMGIRGAAFATSIAYLIGMVWNLSHFLKKESVIRFHRRNFRLEKEIILSIVNIGLSPFSMQIATSLVIILINTTLLRFGGDMAIGAYGIINSVLTLIIMFIIGLNQGIQPIVGYNYGAKKYDRMFKTLRNGILVGCSLSSVGFIVGFFFPAQMVSLFTPDSQMQNIAVYALRTTVLMYPILGLQIVSSNFFQSIGKARISIFLSLTRQFIFLIPCLIILPPIFGLKGAWWAMPISDGLAVLLAVVTLISFIKKFEREKELIA